MRKRRTQEERSRETQRLVLEATLACILEHGLRDTSTTLVSQRSGMSRGALVHHYPTKERLLQEALRHLLTAETEHIRQLASARGAGALDPFEFIDALWERFSGDMFMITLEFVTAARTDRAIRDVLVPVAMEFNRTLDEIWEQCFRSDGRDDASSRTALNATLCLLRGMGVQFVWRGESDPGYFRELLRYWKGVLEESLRHPALPPAAAGARRSV